MEAVMLYGKSIIRLKNMGLSNNSSSESKSVRDYKSSQSLYCKLISLFIKCKIIFYIL